MKYDIIHALTSLKPGSEWVLRGSDYSGIEWLDSSQTKPTETEVNSKISELDNAEPMRLLRIERDKKIALTDWRVLPDQTPSDDWINYRQALRDITDGASPTLTNGVLGGVTWPLKPA